MQLLDEEDKKKNSVSLQILKDSIYSNYTKKVYVNAIKMYSRYFDIKDYDELIRFDKNQTVDMIRPLMTAIIQCLEAQNRLNRAKKR
jgi:hypothetical protein